MTTLVSKSTKLLSSLIEGYFDHTLLIILFRNTTINISKYLAENLEMNFIKYRLIEVYK